MALRPTVPRLEAALAAEPTSFPCPCCGQLIFAPGWYCSDCEACAFPTLLLDADYELDADFEPSGDDEPDTDYV
jgi:hypothetical protein